LINTFSQDSEEIKNNNDRVIPKTVVDFLQKLIKEVKSVDDLLIRAKGILRKYSDQSEDLTVKIEDVLDKLFL